MKRRSRHYFGRICARHPELRGERYADRHCAGCMRERATKYHKRDRELVQRAPRPTRRVAATRQKALRSGAMFYAGKPCLRGYAGVRYAHNGVCLECNRSVWGRLTPAEKKRRRLAGRTHDRRAARALRVLQELGLRL
jgi:hypothetical protein